MKIMPISSRINPSFKSNEPIAFDDAVLTILKMVKSF